MTKRELTLRLAKMNQAGTVMTIYADGSKAQQILPDSIIPLRVEGGTFWLLIKQLGYLKKPERCMTIKVVDYLVNAFLEDEQHGAQWLTITLQDDKDSLYLVEIIEPFCDPEAHRRWRKWQQYRKNNKKELAAVDVELLRQHQLKADTWDGG